MSSAGTNPMAGMMTGGAVGDLGLSSAAQSEAKDIADKLKKKKLQDMATGAGGAGADNPTSALASLLGGTL